MEVMEFGGKVNLEIIVMFGYKLTLPRKSFQNKVKMKKNLQLSSQT